MRRKITFLLTFLVAVLIIALAGGRVYADTGYEVEDYTNQDFCYVNQDTGYEAVITVSSRSNGYRDPTIMPAWKRF